MPKPNGRTPLDKLYKHWKRASPEERQAFLDHLGLSRPVQPEEGTAPHHKTGGMLIANGRYLLPETVTRIRTILVARRIGPAELAEEIGFVDQAVPLARALTRQSSLRLAVIAALTGWIATNEARALR